MWIVRSLRLLYAVGIPALALFWRGALTSTGMGLKPFFWADNHAFDGNPVSWADWLHDIGWACLVALGLWLMVTIGEYNAKRLTVQRNTRRHNLGFAIREAVYHQIHWAFYREPFVLLWGIGIGAWAGLAPVAAEALVNPARWSDAQSPARGRDLLIRVGLAVMSAILYIETQNIWVILIADALLVWVLGHTPERTPRP